MFCTQQVVHRLDRVEGRERHFDEDGVPVRHGTIPKTREFERLEFLAVFRLGGDEGRLWVNKVGKVVGFTLVVFESANEVNRVEVSAFLEHLDVVGVLLVNLAAFKDLEREGAVAVIDEERTSARFTDVLDHTADTDRTVQFRLHVDDEVGVFEILDLWVTDAKVVAHETDDAFELGVCVFAAFEQFHVFEGLLLHRDENAGDELLIGDGIVFQTVGHDVVDILDEDDISVEVVQVLNQSAMATGPEEDGTVGSAEWLIVSRSGYGVGRGLLFGETDVVVYVELLLVGGFLLLNKGFEQSTVFWRNGEVQVDDTIGCSIECAFDKVFFERCAGSFGIVMEEEQTLGQFAVVESLAFEQVADDGFVFSVCYQRINALSFVLLTGSIECVEESKRMDVLEEVAHEVVVRRVAFAVKEGKQVLEHTAGGSTGRYELDDFAVASEVFLPGFDVVCLLFCRRDGDALLG